MHGACGCLQRAELKAIVLAHHGLVATSREAATHEIVPDPAEAEPEDEYCRTIEFQVRMNEDRGCRRGQNVLGMREAMKEWRLRRYRLC